MDGITEREEAVLVRGLRPQDLDAVIAIDAAHVGRRRDEYFKVKLQQNLTETGIKVSLAAELDGQFSGFLLARVYYGEFGTTEPVAVLDTVGVHPRLAGRGAGHALLDQLRTNLRALGVAKIETQVSWDDPALLAFFHRQGFRPAARLCLDLDLETANR